MNASVASKINDHYDASYFEWQRPGGIFGGVANLIKFAPYVRREDRVLDFGAGGGFLLENLNCASKVGVEINAAARADAKKRGIELVATLDEIPDGSIDLIISDNALEHVDFPLGQLEKAYRKLKPGGRAVFVVPCESIGYLYEPEDINFHMYSWSPMCIGNLFKRAGFTVIESKPFVHKWPPKNRLLQRLVGWNLFHVAARIWGHLARHWFQVRCVAQKPLN